MEAFFELIQIVMAIGLCGIVMSMIVFGLFVTARFLLKKCSSKLCRRMDIILSWNRKLLRWSFNLFGAGMLIMMIWGIFAGFNSLFAKS